MEEMEVEKRDDRDLTRSRMLEYQHICKDGSKVWVETKITFLRDNNNTAAAILGSTRNISIRKQSEMALAESFERLKKSFGVTIK
jgi:PAS domain S-box-containing protein